GLERRFAFEDWPLHAGEPCAAWERMREEARALAEERKRAAGTRPPVLIVGADRSAPAIEAARRNAERAGLGGALQLERRELGDARPPAGAPPGLVLINPP